MAAVDENGQRIERSRKGPGEIGGVKMSVRGGHKSRQAADSAQRVPDKLKDRIGFDAGNKGQRLRDSPEGKKNGINGRKVGHGQNLRCYSEDDNSRFS